MPMDTGTFFKMFLFLIVVGLAASMMGGGTMPSAPDLEGNLSIFNFTGIVQIPLMNTTAVTTCTIISTNETEVCYYQFNDCTYGGCPTVCHDADSGFLNITGIIHSLYCIAEGFMWLVELLLNFLIMVANFVIWVVNFVIRVLALIIALAVFLAALVTFFSGISTLFGGGFIALPGGLGVILGVILLFMWAFLAIDVLTRLKGMVFPQ